MAVRIQETTKDDLVAVPVPQYFKGQVLAHKFVMDYMEEKLSEAGHSIEEEVYRATADGGIAHCIYKLGNGKLVAWTNSYMQGMRFKCGSGIYFKEGACMIADLEPPLTRKVDVDVRVKGEIDAMITNLDSTYNVSVEMLKDMKNIEVSPEVQGEILGVLFGTHKNLTSEQAAIVARTIKNDARAMSVLYHDVATALKKSHPRSWMDDQRTLHSVFHNKMAVVGDADIDKDLTTLELEADAPVVDPAQVNMLDQIEEMEQTIAEAPGPQPDVAEVEAPPMQTAGAMHHTAWELGSVDQKSNEGSFSDMDSSLDADVAEIDPPSDGVMEAAPESPQSEVQEDIPDRPGPVADVAEVDSPDEMQTSEEEFVFSEEDDEGSLDFEL
jgi:hypothetical protein